MIVSVFGSSSPTPSSIIYQEAFRLGRQIAHHGHIVMNGGYSGLMEAVSRGAAESEGKVIGVTCNEIEKWRPVKPNPWITEEVRFETLQERLFFLVSHCDSAVALPGGIGTLTEISLIWNLVVTEAFEKKPIWLVGQQWKKIIQSFFDYMHDYIPEMQRAHLVFFDNIDEIINSLGKM